MSGLELYAFIAVTFFLPLIGGAVFAVVLSRRAERETRAWRAGRGY